MPYATYADFVGALNQFQGDPAPPIEAIQDRLDWATAIIHIELGLTALLTTATAATKTVYGDGTAFLALPAHTPDSVTLVTQTGGYSIPDYIQRDGYLIVTDATGIRTSYGYAGLTPGFGAYGVWAYGVPYAVTAAYGVSDDVLDALRAANLELAVQLWRYRDSGGSIVISTEDAAIAVRNRFSPVLAGILTKIRQNRDGVGVW